jgi:hypothetical protein
MNYSGFTTDCTARIVLEKGRGLCASFLRPCEQYMWIAG